VPFMPTTIWNPSTSLLAGRDGEVLQRLQGGVRREPLARGDRGGAERNHGGPHISTPSAPIGTSPSSSTIPDPAFQAPAAGA
jgi:hypothetical protein